MVENLVAIGGGTWSDSEWSDTSGHGAVFVQLV